MTLTPGTQIGPYQIVSPLGQGGMGEVYRARDTKLNRDVALKVLPTEFALDADRLARFRREAQLLATLNHQNVAAIYGFEDADGSHALILELVDGLTLADRIAQGPIPFDEAIPIAQQVADALEAAHEQGIVHRDLKPANIKLRPDGMVKVLDFGLAKALDSGSGASGGPGGLATMSPTITTPAMTQLGVILGTAAYMSPEQAKGRPVDKRSDIWAFGAVLYEMLSGKRAFAGDDISDTLASILKSEPDWTALPATTPPAMRRLITRCLDRDPKRRLRDIGEARIVLDDPAARDATTESVSAASPVVASPRPLWRRSIPIAMTAVISGLLVAAAARMLRSSASPVVARFAFTLGEGQVFTTSGRHLVTMSPDGTAIAYVALPGRIYVRTISELDAKPIQGLGAVPIAASPVFSADGRSLAFYSPGDATLKRIGLTGGTPVTLCAAETVYGMSWEADNTILFGQGRKGVMRVSANGGTPGQLVKARDGELLHGPQMLPDGQSVLFTAAHAAQDANAQIDLWDKADIVVQRLKSGERRTLVQGGSDARYLPTGHLVYAVGGTVFAVPFDVDRLEVKGAPVPIIEGVRRASGTPPATGAANFSISRTGALIYLPGPASVVAGDQLEIIIADGATVTRLKLPPGPYTHPRVSSDGQRIAFGTDDGQQATVWVYELSGTSAMRPLTFTGHNRFPIWTPDGKRVVFQSDRDGDLGIFAVPADSSSAAERLTKADQGTAHIPESWSPTADVLAYSVIKAGDYSLWTFSMPTKKSTPFGEVHSAGPTGAVFSPSGRWLAYSVFNNQTSRTAVYIEPFPPTGTKHQLFSTATDSPHHQVWAPNGKTLFYNPRAGSFESVSVTTQPTLAFGNPVPVPRPFTTGGPLVRRPFDITPDGKFVGLVEAGQGDLGATTAPVILVVLNWLEELKQRVPVK